MFAEEKETGPRIRFGFLELPALTTGSVWKFMKFSEHDLGRISSSHGVKSREISMVFTPWHPWPCAGAAWNPVGGGHHAGVTREPNQGVQYGTVLAAVQGHAPKTWTLNNWLVDITMEQERHER